MKNKGNQKTAYRECASGANCGAAMPLQYSWQLAIYASAHPVATQVYIK